MHQNGTIYLLDAAESRRREIEAILHLGHFRYASFSQTEDLLAEMPAKNASCLILNLDMPDALRVIERCNQPEATRLSIIGLTASNDIPLIVNSMKAGAADVLTLPVDGLELLSSIRHVCEAGARQREKHADVLRVRERWAALNDREREMIHLIADGLSSKQVAEKLGISIKTVSNRRSRIMAKLDAANTAEMVRIAVLAREPQ